MSRPIDKDFTQSEQFGDEFSVDNNHLTRCWGTINNIKQTLINEGLISQTNSWQFELYDLIRSNQFRFSFSHEFGLGVSIDHLYTLDDQAKSNLLWWALYYEALLPEAYTFPLRELIKQQFAEI